MALSPLKTPAYEVSNWLQYGNGTGAVGPEGGNKVGLYANHGKYTLYDNRTGKVLAEGSTPEELKNISDIISGTLVPQGNDADWRLYSTNPVIQTQPHREFRDGGEGPLKLEGNPFGDVIQGYNDLSTPGDPRGTVIAGDMPNNFIKDMALPLLAPIAGTALAYFGGNALLGAGGGGGGAGAGGLSSTAGSGAGVTSTGGALGSVAPATTATTAASVAPEVITVLGKLGPVALTGTQAAALGGGLLSGAGLMTGGFGGAGGATGATGAGSSTGASTGAGTGAGTAADQIVVNAVKGGNMFGFTPGQVAAVNAAATGAATGAGSSSGAGNVGNPDEIVVTANGKPVSALDQFLNGTMTSSQIGEMANQLVNQSQPASTSNSGGKPTSTIGKIIDYTQLAGLLSGTLGSLFGGGGGSGGGKYLGSGNRSPIFSAKLPEPSLPGGVKTMTARTMPEQNWYEYGFHPAQSFFNTSAPGYTPQPGKTPGMARGGDFAVRGPGDGRSDSIPARLSDGEYVMDAETVALLGNGSPKAGAERLDAFRVSIRKHKGRNLAQGKFSVKAKRPEAYLAGGRT